ncbi:MAG: hypothetical protein Roseis2KO_60930 [Roseivirga sp.]
MLQDMKRGEMLQSVVLFINRSDLVGPDLESDLIVPENIGRVDGH